MVSGVFWNMIPYPHVEVLRMHETICSGARHPMSSYCYLKFYYSDRWNSYCTAHVCGTVERLRVGYNIIGMAHYGGKLSHNSLYNLQSMTCCTRYSTCHELNQQPTLGNFKRVSSNLLYSLQSMPCCTVSSSCNEINQQPNLGNFTRVLQCKK